jgi:HEAT repeat protein
MTLPDIDLVSFALGFGIATLFWLIVWRIVKLSPKLKQAAIDNRLKLDSQKNIHREHAIRLFTLRQTQKSHLAGTLFALEKILIDPMVIAPPDCLPGIGDEEFKASLDSILPYTPEIPELLANFPTRRIPLSTIFETYQYFFLSGDPGTGKTTALSALASNLAKDDSKFLPVFVDPHILLGSEEPIVSQLITHLGANIPGIPIANLEDILTQSARREQLAIFIDRLDELEKEEFDNAIKKIAEIQTTFPKARIITTSSTFYFGKLEELGFLSFTLSSWNITEQHQLIEKWANTLLEINNASSNENKQQLKTRLERIRLWLMQENSHLSPFDFTLQIWFSLFNTIQSPEPNQLIETYLGFVSEGHVSLEAFSALVEGISEDEGRYFTPEKFLQVLSSNSTFFIQTERSDTSVENATPVSLSGGNKAENKVTEKNILDLLIANGLLACLPDGRIKFNHLNLPGYLRNKINPLPATNLVKTVQSPLEQATVGYKGYSESELTDFINWLNQNDPQLFRNYLIGMNWLSQISWVNPLRPEIYKRAARLLQDRFIPIGLRARFLFFLTQTNDNSIFSLLGILKGSRDDSVRQLAALGLGLFNDDKAAAFLAELAEDENIDVQKMAILALGRIWTLATQDVLVNAIFNADETIRSYACELLGLHGPDGYEMLKEITATDNYLARKAAISGLLKIKEPWVHDLLEKMSVEDTQWVVRDAAVNALARFTDSGEIKPLVWIPVTENPWTLEKSEEFGIPLPSKTFPDVLLNTVLVNGTTADKRIALHYLTAYPTPVLIKTLTQIAHQEESDIREEAINALFSLSKRGLDIQP